MALLAFFQWLNNSILVIPSIILFCGAGILLTIKTGFLQIRGIPRFFQLITRGIRQKKQAGQLQTISSAHALFTAMATTIGIGNVVSPSVAIMVGGPGALFWLILYIIIGSSVKFTEVVFALRTRVKSPDGQVVGGPMLYLALVSPWLAWWYGSAIAVLMAGWSAVQANTLASILAQESIPLWVTGLALASFVWVVLQGGAHRVGDVATALVPLMCACYVIFALSILLSDVQALVAAIKLIYRGIWSPQAAAGGLVSITFIQALRTGIYRGIFITESGLGTSSISHSLADVERPTDQGILAMFSAGADALLSLLSGLIVLVTGIWTQGTFRSTLVYEAFKNHVPYIGRWLLALTIALFALTTVVGNSFNGRQSFASLTNFRWVSLYSAFTVLTIFLGSLLHVQLVWEMMDTLLMFVALPNLVGVLYLAYAKPQLLENDVLK